jgi:hypothetical protein
MYSSYFPELRCEGEYTERGSVIVTTLYILRRKYMTPIPVPVAERNPDAVVESIGVSPCRDNVVGFYFADRVDTVALIGGEYVKLTFDARSFNDSGTYWLEGAKETRQSRWGVRYMVDRFGEEHFLGKNDAILAN